MGIILNIVATLLVAVCFGSILYFIPNIIVESEWRNEQSANEIDKTTSYELRSLREEYIGRAIRAFRSATHSRDEVESFLQQYTEKTQPLYEIVLKENKWTDIYVVARTEIYYDNVLLLLISYALTTGYENIEIKSLLGRSLLVLFSYVATVLLLIVVGAMSQLNNGLLRKFVGWILGIDRTERNPNKMYYTYMYDVSKREAILLVITFFFSAGGITAGAAVMKKDQKDWPWSVALIYAQAAAFTSGHTKYIPKLIETNLGSVKYGLFILTLHVWMITLLAMFFAAVISFFRSVYNSQWAEISEEEFAVLKQQIESRKRQRQLDNPKYEE